MPLPPDIVPLIREFASNSFRYLFGQTDNVADLLHWREPEIARDIDFSHLVVQPETFIAPSFALMESDIILRGPFRVRPGRVGSIEVFILIEHQSEPDELMVFRVLHYVILIYQRQAEVWLKTHTNLRKFRFNPVLPLVFYSGTRSWEKLLPMLDLVQQGKLFGKRIPAIEPEFVNLSKASVADLQGKAGTFGWVLWLIQQRRRALGGFRDVLGEVVARIERLQDASRPRWESLLWYLHAMIYHNRKPGEREPLAEFIREGVRKANQSEVLSMSKTIAEALKDEGKKVGKEEGAIERSRDYLLLQMKEKFKKVPESIVAEVQAAQDIEQFDLWGRAILTAHTLADMPFKARP